MIYVIGSLKAILQVNDFLLTQIDNMKRALLLMTVNTYRASAYMEAAEKAGVMVTVGTDRPDVLGELNPGGSLTLDYHQPEAAAQIITSFAESYPINAIVSVDDDTVIVGAIAAEKMDLPAHTVEAARATRSKYELRKLLDEEGLPSPEFRLIAADENPKNIAKTVSYPCVLKPTFLSASQGVIRANNEAEFAAAYQRIAAILDDPDTKERGSTEAEMILVEEYLPGTEVALEGLVAGGALHVLAIFDKPEPMEGPYFEETIYVTPSRLPAETQTKLKWTAERASKTIGLQDGPVHAEFRINEKGIWVLDIASRSIGGKCSNALEFEDGATLEELILARALGMEPPSLERENIASGVMMIPIPGSGILRKVEGQEEALSVLGIQSIDISIHIGGRVVPLPEGDRYLGFIFAKGERPEIVEDALRQAHRTLKFRIDPE